MNSNSAALPSIVSTILFAAAASAATYTIDEGKSQVNFHVGKAGFLSAAGHEHDVKATGFSGKIELHPGTPQDASLQLTFPSAGLKVVAQEEPSGDAPKVQEAMVGPECLDVQKFPTISFRSSKVDSKPSDDNVWAVVLTGELDLHGTKKPLTFPVTVTVKGGTLTAKGRVAFKQSDYGIKPISAAGGTVNVKDELVMSFTIIANAVAPGR